MTPSSLVHKHQNFGENCFLNVQNIRYRQEDPSMHRCLLILRCLLIYRCLLMHRCLLIHHAGYEDRKLRICLIIPNLTRWWAFFTENCEKRLLTSSCLSVCAHGTTRLQRDRFTWNFDIWFSKIVEKIQVSFKSAENNGYLARGPITGTLRGDL